jgi:DNA-binding NarL/FixJ family response regulator
MEIMPKYKYTTKIAIADDHSIVRHGVRRLIETETDMEVCAELDGSEDIVTVVDDAKPDILIVDIALGRSDGIVLTRKLRNSGCRIPIIILSMHESQVYVARAIRAGANGYVAKSKSTALLIEAIREVRQGRFFVNGEDADDILKSIIAQHGLGLSIPLEELSDRERQIFALIGQGNSTVEIAETLRIKPKTVETYKGRIKHKLELNHAPQLSMAAVEWATSERLTASAVT